MNDKVRENRLRRMCERRGWQLQKSRRRDPQAWDYGTYGIVDPTQNRLVAGSAQTTYGLNLDEIEGFLTAGFKQGVVV